jgi:hypothetical protein
MVLPLDPQSICLPCPASTDKARPSLFWNHSLITEWTKEAGLQASRISEMSPFIAENDSRLQPQATSVAWQCIIGSTAHLKLRRRKPKVSDEEPTATRGGWPNLSKVSRWKPTGQGRNVLRSVEIKGYAYS